MTNKPILRIINDKTEDCEFNCGQLQLVDKNDSVLIKCIKWSRKKPYEPTIVETELTSLIEAAGRIIASGFKSLKELEESIEEMNDDT